MGCGVIQLEFTPVSSKHGLWGDPSWDSPPFTVNMGCGVIPAGIHPIRIHQPITKEQSHRWVKK